MTQETPETSANDEPPYLQARRADKAEMGRVAAGRALASMRRNARVEQAWLADQLGYSQQLLSKMENAERTLDFGTFFNAAHLLDYTPEQAAMELLEAYNKLLKTGTFRSLHQR